MEHDKSILNFADYVHSVVARLNNPDESTKKAAEKFERLYARLKKPDKR